MIFYKKPAEWKWVSGQTWVNDFGLYRLCRCSCGLVGLFDSFRSCPHHRVQNLLVFRSCGSFGYSCGGCRFSLGLLDQFLKGPEGWSEKWSSEGKAKIFISKIKSIGEHRKSIEYWTTLVAGGNNETTFLNPCYLPRDNIYSPNMHTKYEIVWVHFIYIFCPA